MCQAHGEEVVSLQINLTDQRIQQEVEDLLQRKATHQKLCTLNVREMFIDLAEQVEYLLCFLVNQNGVKFLLLNLLARKCQRSRRNPSPIGMGKLCQGWMDADWPTPQTTHKVDL